MAQHDMVIANDTAASVRADLNLALAALVSQNSGTSEPSTTYANQMWYDTTNNLLKMRNEDDDAWITLLTLDQSGDLVEDVTSNTLTVVNAITNAAMRYRPGYVENISFTLSTQTVTVHGADGTALSSTNPGYICLPSNSTAGQLVLYTITANQAMTNTEMNGNLFGTTTSTAYAKAKPLFLYALSNDAESAIAFAWGAIPHITTAPASTEIGDPSSAVADEQISLYSFDDITETLYDGNQCLSLGSCTAQKDASDIWTFDSFGSFDGMGLFQEGRRHEYASGHHGADSGTFCLPNGGTAAVYSTVKVYYYLSRNGFIFLEYSLRNDGGTDGSGAVDAKYTVPFYSVDDVSGIAGTVTGGQVRIAGGNYYHTTFHIRSDNQNSMLWYNTASQIPNWADFTNGNRNVHASLTYRVRNIA